MHTVRIKFPSIFLLPVYIFQSSQRQLLLRALLICRAMSADVTPSSSSSSTEMSSPTCIEFLPVEFMIFSLAFIVGLASNAFFVLVSFKTRLMNAKDCYQKHNIYLVHWSIANLILLVFHMPFEVISFTVASRSWFFGEHWCSLHLFIERGLYFSIATHLVYMIRDAYEPFGYPKHPTQMTTNWCMSLLFMFPVLLAAELVDTKGGCMKCSMENNLLTKMPVWQWTQELYVAVLPLVAIGFYSNKYGEHPDYENLAKKDLNNDGNGTSKLQLRPMCLGLALILCVCTSPARFTEMTDGEFKYWPLRHIIFFFTPRLLIYGQTILFTMMCASYYPSYYQRAQIVVARLFGCRLLPDMFITVQVDEKRDLLLKT